MTIDSTNRTVETEGKVLSNRFQPTKARSVSNLQAAIESFLAARPSMSREYLAENICGMSLGNFSKVSNALQGDFLAFVKEKLPGEIREDYEDREQKDRQHDPMLAAAEAMVQAAFAMLRVTGRTLPFPERRTVKAELPMTQERRSA